MASEPVFRGGGLERPLGVRRHPRARSMRLAIDPRDGAIWLTLPPRAPVAPGLRWAEERREWIERALGRIVPRSPLTSGCQLPIDGLARTIDWEENRPRKPRLLADRIEVGGPEAGLERRILAWMRREALDVLAAESRTMAAGAGITVGAVRVGDPRSRWASCSAAGDVRYSWRLVMAPPEVRRAVVAHELAHRLHMDHSPAFHRAVARLFGREPLAERRWLREQGPTLHRVGAGQR